MKKLPVLLSTPLSLFLCLHTFVMPMSMSPAIRHLLRVGTVGFIVAFPAVAHVPPRCGRCWKHTGKSHGQSIRPDTLSLVLAPLHLILNPAAPGELCDHAHFADEDTETRIGEGM